MSLPTVKPSSPGRASGPCPTFTRRRWLSAVSAATLAWTFGGCSLVPRAGGASPTTVHFINSGTEPAADRPSPNSPDVVKKFEQEYPNVKVVRQWVPSNYPETLLTAIAGGVPPDVAYLGQSSLAEFVSRKVVHPLDSFIQSDKSYNADDVFPVYWRAWTIDGQRQGLPWQGGPFVLYYHTSLFDAAGVSHPTGEWTWDNWLDAAKKLTRRNSNGPVEQYGTTTYNWAYWVWSAGGDVLDATLKRCTLGDKPALDGFQKLAEFAQAKVIPLSSQSAGQFNQFVQSLFISRKLAMHIANHQAGTIPGFYTSEVGISYLPKGPNGRQSTFPGDGYFMAAATKVPEAAWDVLKFQTGDWYRRYLFSHGVGGVPALKSTAASSEYLDAVLPRSWNEFFIQNVTTCHPNPPSPQWIEIDGILTSDVDALTNSQMTAAQLVADVVPKINRLVGS